MSETVESVMELVEVYRCDQPDSYMPMRRAVEAVFAERDAALRAQAQMAAAGFKSYEEQFKPLLAERDRLEAQVREYERAIRNARNYLQGRPNCDGLNRTVNELEDIIARLDAKEKS